MNAIKRNIPNFITSLNLVCGCIGIMLLIQGYIIWAIYMVFFAAVFDFFDGFVARLLKVTSPIGRDLDSLADVVTFGVLPGLLMWHIFLINDGAILLLNRNNLILSRVGTASFISFIAVLIPVFSAIRLAKFNNDKEQSYYFKGLPTPANGIFIVCFCHWIITNGGLANPTLGPLTNSTGRVFIHADELTFTGIVLHPIALCLLVIVLSILLVSNIKLMAFKFKGFGWKANQWKYILLILCLPLVVFLKFASAPIILILYIIISQIHFRTKKDEI